MIEELRRLADKYTNGTSDERAAAVVLITLCGALMGGTVHALATQCTEFSKYQLMELLKEAAR